MDFDLGFLGGGQLARMSIQAAQRAGLRCLSLDSAGSPASQIAQALIGNIHDPIDIAKLASQCNRLTLENEFVPSAAIFEAGAAEQILPGPRCLGVIQDKLTQRQAYLSAGVPSPRAIALTNAADIPNDWCFPVVLKSRFGGYDGKGTRIAGTRQEVTEALSEVGDQPWLAEEFVDFGRELAQMVVRTQTATKVFATVETLQTHHVCDLVYPAWRDASEIAIAAVEAVSGYGLFGVELFEAQDGSLLVNEIAPRPHNTGHFTLDSGGISQFEAHIRAVMGYAIPDLEQPLQSVMANLLGIQNSNPAQFNEAREAAVGLGGRFHWYGKADSRPGRKMGHINVVGTWDDATGQLVNQARAARAEFEKVWGQS